MNLIKKILMTIVGTLFLIIFPFVILTLVSSKTPAVFGIRSFVVLSGSMQPLFPVGSVVYTSPQNVYKTGDIITYKEDADKNITHRIVGLIRKNGDSFYITRGDANNVNDAKPVSKDMIIGKAFSFAPYMGLLINYLKTPLYFALLIVLPSLIFIALELWNIKKEIEIAAEKRILERLQRQQTIYE